MKLKKIESTDYKANLIIIADKQNTFRNLGLAEDQITYLKEKIEQGKEQIFLNKFDKKIFVQIIDNSTEDKNKLKEKARKGAKTICSMVNDEKIENIQITSVGTDKDIVLAFVEGLALSNYQFLKYFTKDLDKKKNTLTSLEIANEAISDEELNKLQAVIDSVYIVRDLVNEPYHSLNSETFPERIKELASEAGFSAEILGRKQIEALRMGGLLAVNRGSKYDPAFAILSWKPQDAKNEKPVILVGKGVVFDSGGLNLKPTGYIEEMKSDMAGAAAALGTIYAVAKQKLPLYVMALIPITDNAISDRSYAPGEVITMFDGTTVEIKNTDAEGRLILADALSYAKKYEPQLVVDLATLTGAAMRAVGPHASAMLSTANRDTTDKLLQSGFETYERLVEFPLWEEYGEMLKSKIADMKNIGGANAGLITAAKFLEHFTDYPWIHLDIAPNAYMEDNNDYKGTGATAMGVRLLTDFLKKLS